MDAPAPSGDCPFCRPEEARIVWRSEQCFALADRYPVSPGHTLVIPWLHRATWFDSTTAEQAALMDGVRAVRAILELKHRPDGYNIGINAGAAAGQTIFHLHVHVIPRFTGDVPDPRGGVRHAIPGRGNPYREA